MAISYDNLLTQEQKKEIVQGRLQQFAAEAYQTQLNRETQVRDNNEEAISSYDATLSLLESAIEVHQEELTKLDSE
jgi:hypothetical protein